MGFGTIGAFLGGLMTACLLFFSGGPQDVDVSDSSTLSCLDKIEREVEIMTQKFPGKVKSNIQEYNKFDNNQSALDYLEEWDYLGPYKYITFPEFFRIDENIEYNDIIIFLIKIEASYNGESGGGLMPIVCIDGSLTEMSKQRLTILY